MENSLKVAVGSFAISLLVLTIKFAAYEVTGSVALLSDALESIINVVTALAVIVSVRIAAAPPDEEHPYGHHKAEYLSAVLVGCLILAAAVAIMREAYFGFIDPKPIEAATTGLVISSLATVLNVAWATLLIRQGRRNRSASLVADGKHLMADVITSVGVIVGVILVIATAIPQLDAIVAAMVALHVLWSGWGVLKENASGLMDEAAPAGELARIREIISLNAHNAIEAHALRTRHAGQATFIDFHLVVVQSMSVGEAHDICDRVEDALRAEIPGSIISIHVEPEGKAKHRGIVIA
jgi:cation diffusion facilitator family transporter